MTVRWRKKIALAATVAAVAATAAGCSSAGGNTGSGNTESGSSATSGDLTVTWNNHEQAGMEAIVAAFTKKYPNVHITLKWGDGQADAQAALRAALSAGDPTDVEWVWPGNGNAGAIEQLAPGNFFVDLSSQPWASRYPASMRAEVAVNGHVIMMAPSQMAFPLIINDTALQKYGLTAPTNWNQLLTFCAAAKKAGVSGLGLAGADPYGAISEEFALVGDDVYGTGTAPNVDQQVDSGQVTFPNSPGWVLFMNQFTQLRDSGCYPKDFTGVTPAQEMQQLATGQVLMGFNAGVLLGPIEQLNPKDTFSFGSIASNPNGKNMVVIQTIGGGAIPKASHHIALATTFLDFLGANTELYSNAIPGNIPTTAQNYTPPGPNEQFLVSAVESGRAVHYADLLWPTATTDGALLSGLQAIDLNRETGAQVLQAMAATFKS
jgi:raffinose/stachyose/melibiose transport system substrate-binding protein